MHAIIFIEKYDDSSFYWDYLLNHKKIHGLSVEEIINRYQGFEGDIISFSLFCENQNLLKANLYSKKLESSLLLHVFSGDFMIPEYLKMQLVHQGYDIGVCEQEKTIYSSIFNEILFGNIPELIVYQEFLNNNFLFPDRMIAEEYVTLHNKLSILQKDVEDYEEVIVYDIWK